MTTAAAAGATDTQQVDTPPLDDFDSAFDEAVKTAEKDIQNPPADKFDANGDPEKTPDPADGNDADAKAQADKKAADDKAAADKATADAAAAAAAATAEAAKVKSPDELLAEKTAAEEATKQAAAEAAAKAATAVVKTPEQIAADTEAAVRTAAEKVARENAAQQAAEAQATKDAQAAQASAYKPFVPSDDDQKVVDNFKKEWSDSAAAVDILMKQQEGVITQRLLNGLQSVLQMVYRDVHPVIQRQTTSATEEHFAAIKKAHSDFDAVIGTAPAWIKTQPKYLQPALQAAYDEGDAEAVIDLVTRLKESTGRVTPQKSEQTPVVTPKPAIDPAVAAALAPVSSKRSTAAPGSVGKVEDFDGAFDEATSSK